MTRRASGLRFVLSGALVPAAYGFLLVPVAVLAWVGIFAPDEPRDRPIAHDSAGIE